MYLKLFYALLFVCLFSTTIGMAYPLFAIFLDDRGMSSTYIGFTAGASAIVTFAITPYYPRIVALLGYRNIILITMSLFAGLVIVFPLVSSPILWLIIRGLTGFSFGTAFLVGELWVQSLTNNTNRGRVLGAYSIVNAGSFAFGSGLLALSGTQGMFPFYCIIFICFLSLIVSLKAPNTRNPEEKQPFMQHLSRLFKMSPIIFLSITVFTVIDQALSPMLPIFAIQHNLADYLKPLLLAFVSIGGIIGQPITGYLIDKSQPDKFLNKHNLFIIYYSFILLWSISLFFVDFIGNPILIFLLFAFGGIFFLGSYTITISIMGTKFKGADLVLMYTMNSVLWSVGSLIGPFLTGVAMDFSKYGLPFVLGLLVIFILIVLSKVNKSWAN